VDEKEKENKEKNKKRVAFNGVLLVSIFAGGLIVLWLLFVSWRRFNKRTSGRKKAKSMPDIWQAGGDRLSGRVEQAMREDAGIASIDDIPDEDDDELGDRDRDDDDDEDETEDDDETFRYGGPDDGDPETH